MKINLIIKILIILLLVSLIVVDITGQFSIAWEKLVTIGGLLSAVSVTLVDILNRVGIFKKIEKNSENDSEELRPFDKKKTRRKEEESENRHE